MKEKLDKKDGRCEINNKKREEVDNVKTKERWENVDGKNRKGNWIKEDGRWKIVKNE